MTTPIPLLRAASRDIYNHDSHDDPAAAGTRATPTAMRTPATMETVMVTAMMTVTVITTTPLRMRPRAQRTPFDRVVVHALSWHGAHDSLQELRIQLYFDVLLS
ncbi:hypothetical protein EDB83DRAFT_2323652 [Lactarius deliciosus]|nr:hypothetical protein EDB83DRAFT_2323652 [Lactarius deliciosus]